jgi:BirA family biotin operon repressor/biotin-[acetyl-CoA-carboxylase] ligase
MADVPHLDLQQVHRLLGTHRFGRHLHHEIECVSTNNLAKAMLAEGAPTGTVVVAESQTAGRGRFQRDWTSAPGLNLLFTVIVRWRRGEMEATWLTLVAALAVRDAVAGLYHLHAALKWPNDVVLTLGDGVQKLAGVLTETSAVGPDEQGAVIGIGLNVNQVWRASEQDPQRPRVSLAAALGRAVDREPLLAACLTGLEERMNLLHDFGPASLVAEAREHLCGVGQPVKVQIPSRTWSGVLAGIDANFHLLLADEAGQTERLHVGEVLFGAER